MLGQEQNRCSQDFLVPPGGGPAIFSAATTHRSLSLALLPASHSGACPAGHVDRTFPSSSSRVTSDGWGELAARRSRRAEACQALLFPSRPRKRNQDGEFPSDADTMLFDDTASATLGGSDRHRPVPSPAPESVRGRLAAAASALPAARADASRRCVRAALFLEPASSRTVRPRRRVRVSESPVRWVGRRQALLRNIGSPRLRRPG